MLSIKSICRTIKHSRRAIINRTIVVQSYSSQYVRIQHNIMTQQYKGHKLLTELLQDHQPTTNEPYKGLEYRFDTIINNNWKNIINKALHNNDNNNNNIVVTIGGDQATGKSTLSKRLAQYLHGSNISAGTVFRNIAKQRNIDVSELSKQALNDISIDVNIDYNLALSVAKGYMDNNNNKNALIIEGRNPSVMATYIKTMYNNANNKRIHRIYLTCSVNEQALRYIEREANDALPLVKQALTKQYNTLEDICNVLYNINNLPYKDKIIQQFHNNIHRDNDDRIRYEILYGKHKLLDYRSNELYDIIIDTTYNQPIDTFNQTIQQLKRIKAINVDTDVHSKL